MSVLLPKSKEEFSKTHYWDNFFKSRGSKAFEWYGEYNELSGLLHKYVKEKDKILIPGCGNSTLGHNLHDVGFRDIVNIDTSQIVIKQMNQKLNDREGLQYLHMDALETTFENETFNVVLDKGTLDALMPDNKVETLERIHKYFDEIQRITKFGSRYICISLLQDHILTILLDYFPNNNWMLRIIRCFDAEQAAVQKGEKLIPVFMVICTKFKALPNKILEGNLYDTEKMQRFEDTDKLKTVILTNQQATFVCSNLQQNVSESEINFDLSEVDDMNPKYTVYVVDSVPNKQNSPYAVFIVPQGRESEWLFSTKTGRQKLASMSRYNRLLIATMHRNRTYGNLDDVQNDLAGIIRDLTPSNVKQEKTPCLSLGTEGVGKRTVLHEGVSEISGGYIVEEVEMEGGKFRRLFFLSNQLVTQSEARLKSYKNRKGILKYAVDLFFLSCKHHLHMTLGAYIACGKRKNTSIAVVGVGGGGLCSFLNKFIPNSKITGVEIDPEMVKIATDWFGLQKNDKLEIEVNDGLKYLQQLADKGRTLDAILFDVDNKDSSIGMSCPPKEFLENQVLDNIKQIIGDRGLFVLNMVLRDESLRNSVVEKLSERFKGIISHKIAQELNEIFICGQIEKEILKENLTEAIRDLNKFLDKNNITDCGIDADTFSIEVKNDLVR